MRGESDHPHLHPSSTAERGPWAAQLPEHSSRGLPTPDFHSGQRPPSQALRTKWKGDEASLKPHSPLWGSCVWRRARVSKETPSSLRPEAPLPVTAQEGSLGAKNTSRGKPPWGLHRRAVEVGALRAGQTALAGGVLGTITFKKGSSSVIKEGNRKHKIAVPETSLTSQGRAQANWQY